MIPSGKGGIAGGGGGWVQPWVTEKPTRREG